MYAKHSIHKTAGLQPAVDTADGPDLSDAIRLTCRLLASSPRVRRIDVTLEPGFSIDRRMPLIRQARATARDWGLDMYVEFRAGALRLTFIK